MIAGSPWRIDVRNPARISVNSSGLHQMSVGKVAIFELNSTDPDCDITVNVTRMYMYFKPLPQLQQKLKVATLATLLESFIAAVNL